MANSDKLLEKMRANPRDWRIEDVGTVCEAYGVAFTAPRKGSHYKVKHLAIAQILTIPAHRPIKPVYIRELIKFIDAVQGAKS
jgi:predicted RNA binding protein YcfA (HicA-like mRNA interferase family)